MPPPRSADLWQTLEPAVAGRIVVQSYGEGAGAEVLLRAFLCERDLQREAVRFWLKVYAALDQAPAGPDAGAPRPGRPPSGAA